MMIAQIAQVATAFVDTVMAGRVSTDDLAAVSLGASVFITSYVTLMGIVTALNPILAHQLGAGEHDKFKDTARQGLWFGLLIGLLGAAMMVALEPALRLWLHLPPEVTDKVMLFITGAAVGMPDQYAGEVPALFVVPAPGSKIDVPALKVHLEQNVPEPPARPRSVLVLDADEHAATVMLDEPAVRARCAGDHLPVGERVTVRLVEANVATQRVAFET